jgi:hypothetical protein
VVFKEEDDDDDDFPSVNNGKLLRTVTRGRVEEGVDECMQEPYNMRLRFDGEFHGCRRFIAVTKGRRISLLRRGMRGSFLDDGIVVVASTGISFFPISNVCNNDDAE